MLDSLFLSKSPSPLLNFDGDFDGLGHDDVMCKKTSRKECIPVGCVPPSLYRTGDLCPGGLSPGWISVGGGESLSRGWEDLCPRGRGGSLSRGGGSLSRGVSVQGVGGLCPGVRGSLSIGCGVLCLEGISVRDTPSVNGMTHSCKNITLPQSSFAGGKKLQFIG